MKRKYFSLLLCVLLVFSISACKGASSGEPSASEPSASEPSASEPAEPEASSQPESTLPATAPLAYGEIELPQLTEVKEGEEIAVMTTNYGVITFRLFPEEAPKTVENFVTHAKNGYYDNVIFHRVGKDFMIQSGDPLGTGTGGESIWGEPFEDEVTPKLHNLRGALSMANTGANTNGSQFFIVQNSKLSEEILSVTQNTLNSLDTVVYEDEDGKYVTIGDQFPKAILEKYLADGGAPHLDFYHTVFGQVIDGMDVVDAIASVEITENPDDPGSGKPVKDVIIEKIEIVPYQG